MFPMFLVRYLVSIQYSGNTAFRLKTTGYENHIELQSELQTMLACVQNNDTSPVGKLCNGKYMYYQYQTAGASLLK